MNNQETQNQFLIEEVAAQNGQGFTNEEAPTAKLHDLTVSEAAGDEVKGGLLLPAIQKVREAAARAQSGLSAGKVSYSDLS